MWVKGRRDTGYLKKEIYTFWNTDLWLLKFPEGSYLDEHVDQVSHGRHFRLNIVLKDPVKGGAFTGDSMFNLFNRIILLRADENKHGVKKIESGTRYVLSFGIVF